MKRSKWLSLAALLMAVGMLGAACGDDDDDGGGGSGGQAGGDCTWVIGTVGALSGDFAAIGEPIRQGVEVGIDKLNEEGLPCEITIQEEDSQGSGDQIPPLAQSLVENEELVAVIGPYFSTETLASGDIFNDAGVPFITPSATNATIDDQGWDAFFRTVPNDEDQGPTASAYIQAVFEPDVVAVAHDNSDYGKALAETVESDLGDAAQGGFVINPEETDYSAVVAEIADTNPDVVYFGGYSPQAGPLAKQLKEAGVDAQFFSDDGTNASDFGELAGAAAEGAQVTTPAADPLKVDGADEFIDAIEQKFDRTPGTFSADAYDSTLLVGEALKELSGDEPIEEVRTAVIEYLDSVEGYEGVTKSYTFKDNGEVDVDPLTDVWIYEWKGDAFVSLGPAADFVE